LNIGLVLYGFQYTSARLTENLYYSMWIALAGVVLRDLLVRWGGIAERRIALQLKREHLAARLDEGSDGGPDEPGDLVDEMDARKLNQQTRRLVYTILGAFVIGLFVLVWSEVLPALTVLDEFRLWQGSTIVEGEERIVPITIVDLLKTVLLVAIVAFVARNMAAILDLLQFNRLPFDAGARYAFATLAQYAVVIIGVFAAFNQVGVNWSDVQWLAAAVTVGLGFGLQEIFANFVSGLIILFERPMRIGDTVEVGKVMGTVTRFRIRATTITDWDNKEIVVPNKIFITNELTNWTLSEQVIRAVMHVGIALDADSELAHRVMLDVAKANPRVLADPEPTVYFLGMGDHLQKFDVRVFVDHIDDWLPVMHEYYSEVMKALKQNGIDVPYPKRDIQIRSVSELGGRQIFARPEPGTAA
jgi:potassium efflux system protein